MDHNTTVDKLIVDEGFVHWNEALINCLFWEEGARLILSIPLSFFKPADQLVWVVEKNGVFSTKSAYLVARSGGDTVEADTTSSEMHRELKHMWKALWRANVLETVKICVWRCCWNAIPTRENLRKRKVITNYTCPFCDGETESIEHVLLECPRSVSIWLSSPLCLRTDRRCHGGLCMWLVEVAGLLARQSFDLVLVLIWSIWKEHNSFVWTGTALNQMDVLCKTQAWLQEFKKWHGRKAGNKHAIHKWEKLGVGWFICNFDGAWDEIGELGGVRVVIRDDNGAC